ncbi:MAG: GAF domain-containing protein, partial [Acidimicrobiales bacterium]
MAEAVVDERSRQDALAAEVGEALTSGVGIGERLQRCAEALCDQLDAAFARVWTVSDDGRDLLLQASAGLYTHLDGPHSRVPVGQFKIGRIAERRQPHLTNDVTTDPLVSDRDWARREAMVAFAGYPLVVGERLVGVMALFARHPLGEPTLRALGSVAAQVAVGIEQARLFEGLREAE